MTADEAIKIAFLRRCQSGQLKPANEGPSLTDPALDPGRQRPVGLALHPANTAEPAAQPQPHPAPTPPSHPHHPTPPPSPPTPPPPAHHPTPPPPPPPPRLPPHPT